MTRELRVSPDLALPQDTVTQALALLAVRRAGKSNAAAVLAEEMHAAGLPWVAIDPKGDWWGLRSSADGTGPGLPIPIFGGLHGDMPLVPEAGALMAELVVEHNLTCVLDVSRFSKAGRIRFLTAFAEKLYELHQADPQPRHMFLEEADRCVPQRVMQDMAACVGAFSDLVRLGGAFGLGITIISQRSALINKDVLSEVEVMIALRTTGPQDRKAIRDWMEHHAIAAELVDSLPGLANGEAWVISSHWLVEQGLPALQRIRFRQRATFDSGATPKVGERARPPATLADIDLGALQTRMDAVVEKATQNDPGKLRRRIADLERKLAAAGREIKPAEPERIEVTVEVPVVTPAAVAALDQSVTAMREAADQIEFALQRARRADSSPAPSPPKAAAPVPARSVAPRTAPATVPDGEAPDIQLGRAHRAILAVLAQFPEGRTKQQVAILTGYAVKGGGFNNALGALRTATLIEGRDYLVINEAGMAAICSEWEPLPEGAELLEHWVGQLPKAERLILGVLAEAWPQPVAKAEVAERTGYTATGGGFNNALGKLRTLQLISGSMELVADETLAQHAQGDVHA